MSIIYYEPTYGSALKNADFPLKQSINNGVTYGEMSMPKKFTVADDGTSFSLGRAAFFRSPIKNQTITELEQLYKKELKLSERTAKGVAYESSGQRIDRLKNNAIGRGSTKTNSQDQRSFKTTFNNNRTTINNALRKVRNIGYVAPPKAAHFPFK